MKYCVSEKVLSDDLNKTAYSKARDDAEKIASDEGYKIINVVSNTGDRVNVGKLKKVYKNLQMANEWKKSLSALKKDDMLFIQLPVINNSFMLGSVIKGLKKKGVYIIALIHDLESLRMAITSNTGVGTNLRIRLEETSVLNLCDKIIVHNQKMYNYMAENGTPKEKMEVLEIFDYLVTPNIVKQIVDKKQYKDIATMIVAGNLAPEKAGYVYSLPAHVKMNLYGVHYKGENHGDICYKGAFNPEELPSKLEGGFGLIWDGETYKTCSGVYGEYLKYNNPHKMSLYLASGVPVIIWNEAAQAKFVEKENVGIIAESIQDAKSKISEITDEQYSVYLHNAKEIGEKLRSGYYLKRALLKAEKEE